MDSIPNELQCAICFQLFDQPVKLPCQHAFCKNCIVESLQNKSLCPICRRVFCLPIDEELKADETLQDYVNKYNETKDGKGLNILPLSYEVFSQWWDKPSTHEGMPVFQFQITTPLNSCCSFNFFEPRYVNMVTQCMKKNLLFAIHGGQRIIDQKYCEIVEIIEANQEQMEDRAIYQCTVRNIGRGRMTNEFKKEFSDSNYPLLYTIPERIVDVIDGIDEESNIEIKQIFLDLFKVIFQIRHHLTELPILILELVFQKLTSVESLLKKIVDFEKVSLEEQEVQKDETVLDNIQPEIVQNELVPNELVQSELFQSELVQNEQKPEQKENGNEEGLIVPNQLEVPSQQQEQKEEQIQNPIQQEQFGKHEDQEQKLQKVKPQSNDNQTQAPIQQQLEIQNPEIALLINEQIQTPVQQEQDKQEQSQIQQNNKDHVNQEKSDKLDEEELQHNSIQIQAPIQQKQDGQLEKEIQQNNDKIQDPSPQEQGGMRQEQAQNSDAPVQFLIEQNQTQNQAQEEEVKVTVEEPQPPLVHYQLAKQDLEKISLFSLQFLSYINTSKDQYFSLYYGTDLKERLSHLKMQMESFLEDHSIHHFKIIDLLQQQ